MRLSRRQVIQASLVGGLLGTFGSLMSPSSTSSTSFGPAPAAGGLDGFNLLRDAVKFGKRISLGGNVARADEPPAAAAAGPNEDSVIVTIKVMNHIHTPLCFKLGGPNYTRVPAVPWASRFGDAKTFNLLMGRGLDEVSDIERFRRLKMNRWWAGILSSGRVETNAIPSVLSADDVADFPGENEVAIQAALGVSQTDLSLNHSFKNCTLPASTDPNRGGDIGFHCAKQGIIKSPLGVVCLNMGNVVETTDAIGNVGNRVVSNDQVTVAALGRTVDAYVRVLGQAVGLGLVDEALVSKFDSFVKGDSTIAESLKQSRTSIQNTLAAMATASQMEQALHQMPNVDGAANFQAVGAGPNQIAKAEFLAQCKFVQQALTIPGKPFRNFNLLLNVVDLDGATLDSASPASNSVALAAAPYNYVEGMRELAIGLNMLAQLIKKHRNVYVVVVSEGGRAMTRGDDKVSHVLMMGPGGGAGNMKDFLYANEQALDSTTDPFNVEPNSGNAQLGGDGQRKPSGNVVMNEANAPIDEHMTTGSLLNGLVRHLETKRGIAPTTAGLGKYVKIQTT